MPAPMPASATLGALLRLVEQEKSKGTAEQTPGQEPVNPLRAAVQAPLESPIAPESPESARVMSLKNEAGITPGGGAEAQTITPGSAKVGPIGGIEEGMGTVPVTQLEPGTMPGEQVQPQPTLDDYLRQGKTASQWYAETGRQSELDKIGKESSFGGVGNIDEFMKSGKIANDKWAVNPQTGQTYEAPRPVSQPNTATLQDYLAQGKTAAQWYAETGRQSELDTLTHGATQPVPTAVQNAWSQGITPTVANGTYTIPAAPVTQAVPGQPQEQTSEFVGPLAKGQLRPQLMPQATSPMPIEDTAQSVWAREIANQPIPTEAATTPTPIPTPTPTMNPTQKAIDDILNDDRLTKEQKAAALQKFIVQPTPRPTFTPQQNTEVVSSYRPTLSR